MFGRSAVHRILGILVAGNVEVSCNRGVNGAVVFTGGRHRTRGVFRIFGGRCPRLGNCTGMVSGGVGCTRSTVSRFSRTGGLPRVTVSISVLSANVSIPRILGLMFFGGIVDGTGF